MSLDLLLDYDERSSFLINPGTETIFTTASLDLPTDTRIKIEVGSVDMASRDTNIEILDNGTLLGVQQRIVTSSPVHLQLGPYAATFLTVSGTHQFEIRATVATDWMQEVDRMWYRILIAPNVLERDYVERATDFSGSNPFIECDPITCDGSTRLRVEAFAPAVSNPDLADVTADLYDNGVNLGTLCHFQTANFRANIAPMFGARYLTPDAGVHTFRIDVNGADAVYADAATYLPAWLRVLE